MSLLNRIQHQGRELTGRALDRHIRLGVTGLSGSGKTAFITSLVQQLTQGDHCTNLPFFDVVREQRYLGGRLASQLLDVPRFPQEQNAAAESTYLASFDFRLESAQSEIAL
jgi:uncharacterized protein